MKKITYVTGNHGKYIEVKEKAEKEGVSVNFFKCDLEEPNINDIGYISKQKAKKAYEKLQSPVFVADTGFYIEAYPNNPGYPGAYVKRSGVSTNVEELLKTMRKEKNRNCYFLDCLTYYDGEEFFQFFGRHDGMLSTSVRGDNIKKAKSNLWYIFIPKGSTKTLAEMTDEEKANSTKTGTSATTEFIKWYKENILGQKILVK